MNYSQIIKRGWEILKNNKFLWGLGILVGLVSGGGGMPFFNIPFNFQSVQPTPAIIQTWPTASPVSRDVNLLTATAGQVLSEIADRRGEVITEPFTPMVISLIILCVVIGITIGLIILYFGLSARAGLILAVEKLETTGEKMTFGSALRAGRKYFWPIFGSCLLYFLYTSVFVLIVGMLVITGWFSHSGPIISFLVILGIILFLAYLVSVFYLTFLYLFVPQLIVLDQLGPIQALKKAHALTKRNWSDILISWVIIIGIGLIVGMAIMLVVFVVLAIFTLLGFGLYFVIKSIVVTVVYGIIVGLILFVAMLIVRGMVTAYVMIYMTLVYRALRYIDGQKSI